MRRSWTRSQFHYKASPCHPPAICYWDAQSSRPTHQPQWTWASALTCNMGLVIRTAGALHKSWWSPPNSAQLVELWAAATHLHTLLRNWQFSPPSQEQAGEDAGDRLADRKAGLKVQGWASACGEVGLCCSLGWPSSVNAPSIPQKRWNTSHSRLKIMHISSCKGCSYRCTIDVANRPAFKFLSVYYVLPRTNYLTSHYLSWQSPVKWQLQYFYCYHNK